MKTFAILAALALAPAMPFAAGIDSVPSFSGAVSIDMNTLGPSPRFPGMSGVWVLYDPTLSVDCSPPRGCYAKTQRIYYAFNCAPRYAVAMERVSFDLNGNVVKDEIADTLSPSYDRAAALVLNTFCPGNFIQN